MILYIQYTKDNITKYELVITVSTKVFEHLNSFLCTAINVDLMISLEFNT